VRAIPVTAARSARQDQAPDRLRTVIGDVEDAVMFFIRQHCPDRSTALVRRHVDGRLHASGEVDSKVPAGGPPEFVTSRRRA
jgi:hypothetical protein